MKRLIILALGSFALVVAARHATGQDLPVSPYLTRPLAVPGLAPGEHCPVSIGDTTVVSSEHRYIFGAGGHFFGAGPVYLALSWKPADRSAASFDLDPVPEIELGYRLKTPWIMHPDYSGEALIRGVQIGSDDPQTVLFSENSQIPRTTPSMILRSGPANSRTLDARAAAVDGIWGFWPSSMILPLPGCYAIQIDTQAGSDIVVFEAIFGSQDAPARRDP